MTTPAHFPEGEFEEQEPVTPSPNDPELTLENLETLYQLTNPLREKTEEPATPSIEVAKHEFLNAFYAPLNIWKKTKFEALTTVWHAIYDEPCLGRALTVTPSNSHIEKMKELSRMPQYKGLNLMKDNYKTLLNIPLGISLRDITDNSGKIFYILLINGVIMEISINGSHSFIIDRNRGPYDINVLPDSDALDSMFPTYSGELSWLPDTTVLRSSFDDDNTAEKLWDDYQSLENLLTETQLKRLARIGRIGNIFTNKKNHPD